MVKSVTVVNYLGDSITIDLTNPRETGFAITNIDGLGPAKANINAADISTSDGAYFSSARLEKRNITMQLVFFEGEESIEQLRLKTYKYFPIKQKVTLIFETENRTAMIEGYVESNEPTIFTSMEYSGISIICPNPYFYSVTDYITNFSGIIPLFEFPFDNNSVSQNRIELSKIEQIVTQHITYNGDAETGIIMRVHANGPVENPVFYNVEKRETMRFNSEKIEAMLGSGIDDGDEIIINTVTGQKSVTLQREGVLYNILNALDRNSDWIHLTRGDNIIGYDADDGVTNMTFEISNKIVYEGI